MKVEHHQHLLLHPCFKKKAAVPETSVLYVLLKIPVDQIGTLRDLGRGGLFLDYDQVNGNDRHQARKR